MSFFEDILDSDTTAGKVFYGVTFLLVAWLLLTAIVGGLILYGVVKPEVRGAGLQASQLLSQPEVLNFAIPGQKDREGWFFPGLTTSPTIILCHGYQTHKADLITMVSALQKDHFNVFVFDFTGHGTTPGTTSLGPREIKDLAAAIDAVLERTDIDRSRVGIWGFDMGGYAAMRVAMDNKRVKAIAVDSVYNEPRVMFNLLAAKSGLSKVPMAVTFARWAYTLMNWSARNDAPLLARIGELKDTPKLFIQGRDNPTLAESTLQLFLHSSEPRKQAVMSKSNYAAMAEDERKAYETEVVHFFLEALPAVVNR